MYDPKFEKAVRQRMEELEFRPAESVWVNIEKAIVDTRRERRVGYYWRFLVPGLLIAAGVAIYVYHNSAGTAHAVKPADPGTARIAAPKTAANATPTAAGNAVPQVVANGVPQVAANAVPKIAGNGEPKVVGNAELKVAGNAMPKVAADVAEGAADHEIAAEELASTGTSAGHEVVGSRHTSMISPWFYMPGLADQRFALTIRASAPNNRKSMISLTSLSPARHPWEAGFVAGGGISRVNRLNVSNANQALLPQALSFYVISGSSAGKNFISDIRPDASFHGGIYLQKALSDRWVFNTGLNLHYYSTQIHVGQQVNVYATQSSSSYWNYVGTAATSSVALYSAGDQHVYTNRYYFLELPAAMQWKVNQSKMLPIFLEGGVSLARLMSANALYYNAQTGVYSKDGSMLNKTQLNIGSALLVGLPFHCVRIQVGPEVQYGVTSLVNNQSLGDQHMFYAGLRVVVLPVKR